MDDTTKAQNGERFTAPDAVSGYPNRGITAHAFARKLLQGPDLPILVPKMKEYSDDDEDCCADPVASEHEGRTADDVPCQDELKVIIACPFCGAPTEVEYASTGTSIECIGDDGCHAMIVLPCFPQEAERLIRAGAVGASNETRGERLAPASWLDALDTAHYNVESAIKYALAADKFETASVLRRAQKSIATIAAAERSASNMAHQPPNELEKGNL